MSFKNRLMDKIIDRRKVHLVLLAAVFTAMSLEAVLGDFAANRLHEYPAVGATSTNFNRRPEVVIAMPRPDSSPAFLRSYMSAAAALPPAINAGEDRRSNPPGRPPVPLSPPPLSSSFVGRDQNDVDRRQSSLSSSSSSSSAASWRWCHICSGKYPDRECELYPKRVTRGPAKTNCTKGFCTSYVRYKPKAHLIVEDDEKRPVAVRPLEPDDFDVTSIARECESFGRGNTCLVDGDQLGVTCYSSCTTHFCNDDTRRPGWQHFRQRQQNSRERHVEDRDDSESAEDDVDGQSKDGYEGRAMNEVDVPDRSEEYQGGGGSDEKEPLEDRVARRLPDENQIHRGGNFDRNGLMDQSAMSEHGVHSKPNNVKPMSANVDGAPGQFHANGTEHSGGNGTSRTPGQPDEVKFLPEPAKSKSGKPTMGLSSAASTLGIFRSASVVVAAALMPSLGFLTKLS